MSLASCPIHKFLPHAALLSAFPCQYLLTPEFVKEAMRHLKLPELDILVECTVCTQLTDTESDSPSSLSQVRDAITAIIIMEVLLALEGHVLKKQEAKKKKRNKKQNQWPEGSVLSAVTLCIKESLVLLDSFES